MKTIGTNMSFFTLKEFEELRLDRMELCLGKNWSYDENVNKINEHLINANKLEIPVSIHLPVYIPPYFKGKFLDAYYLDVDPQKRAMSFDMLEYNLEKFKNSKVDYFVIHFSGRYDEYEPSQIFETKLDKALMRIDKLAIAYETQIMIEYFGSNINFYEPEKWVGKIKKYDHIDILVDITHLYFAAKWRGFDFQNAFSYLVNYAGAFHIWTTYGEGYYDSSEGYKKYQHIVPNLGQNTSDGWAFDTKEIIDLIVETGKPMIVEAAPYYRNVLYYKESIYSICSYMKEKQIG